MKDIMCSGYGQMRNINYRKDDEPFIVTTTVYPIFDVSCVSQNPNNQYEEPNNMPVITHFASVMTNLGSINVSPREKARMLAEDKKRLKSIFISKTNGNTSLGGDLSHIILYFLKI